MPFSRQGQNTDGHRFEEVSKLFGGNSLSRRIPIRTFSRKMNHIKRTGNREEIIPSDIMSDRMMAQELRRHLVRQNRRRIRIIPTRILKKYENIFANLPILLQD